MQRDVFRRSNSSYFVRTPNGELGRAYHEENLIEYKVPVYLVDDTFNPLKDHQGKCLKRLYNPQDLVIIGVTKEF